MPTVTSCTVRASLLVALASIAALAWQTNTVYTSTLTANTFQLHE